MLGKSGGLAIGLAILCTLSCAHNVPQDSKTGEDGRVKGAKPLTLDNGETTAVPLLPLLLNGRHLGLRMPIPKVGAHDAEVAAPPKTARRRGR